MRRYSRKAGAAAVGTVYTNGNGWSSRFTVVLQTVTVAGLFVAALWVGVISPIASREDKIDATKLDVREHEEFKKRLDDTIGKLQHEVIRLQDQKVSHELLDANVKNLETRQQSNSDAIKDVRDQVGGAASIKDALANQQKQLDQIRDRLLVTIPSGKGQPSSP